MKHSPLFSDWWLLQFFFFIYIRYPSNVINFSSLFSSFNNKAGTENQHYHYPFLKIISICKRLIKNTDTLRPFLPLNQGMYFKHKHLLLSWATAKALTNTRWNITLLLWHVRYPPAHPHPRDNKYVPHMCLCCCQKCPWLLVWASLHHSYTERLIFWYITEVSAPTRDQRRTCFPRNSPRSLLCLLAFHFSSLF